jgi:hypothetical protein
LLPGLLTFIGSRIIFDHGQIMNRAAIKVKHFFERGQLWGAKGGAESQD